MTAPGWILLDSDNSASLPVLAPGEVAACRTPWSDDAPGRGELVVAGARGARFLGRVLGLPGERVEPDRGGWRLDRVLAARSERDLLLPLGENTTPGTRSLVYRVGDAYLSLWSRGPVEDAVPQGAAVDLAADEVYVLALEHSAAAVDSRMQGGIPLDLVQAARCVLLWSPSRTARVGRPLTSP